MNNFIKKHKKLDPIFISKLIPKKVDHKEDEESQIRLRREVGSLYEKASEMHSLIEQGLFTSKHLESQLNINKFSSFVFRKLEIISQGDFGKLWRGIDINKRKIITMKEVDVKNMKAERVPDILASLIFERDTIETIKSKLLTKFSRLFCDHIGLFYKTNNDGDIISLISITSAGSCTLADLISARNEFKKSEENIYEGIKLKRTIKPYDIEELTPLIISIKNALEILRQLRIYHSDIKPSNIVYNEELQIFQLYNFGVSQTIPEGEDVVDLEVYGNGGSEKYLSPEKRRYWNHCRRGEKDLLLDEKTFDPFKCDIWSFSKILKDLMLGEEEGDELYKNSFIAISDDDWKKRAYGKDVDFYKDMGFETEFKNYEEKYLKMIKAEKRDNKDWGTTLKRFDVAKEDPENIENLNQEYKIELNQNGGVTDGKEGLFAEIKLKKGA